MTPPYVASEISASLLGALGGEVTAVFALERLTLAGSELESLMRSAWMIGYSRALTEIHEADGPLPPLPPLAAWIAERSAA